MDPPEDPLMAVLNQSSANKIEATSKRADHQVTGCDCLYLRVQPSGQKSWYYKFRRPRTKGAKDKIRLGSFEALTLAEAKVIGARMNEARERGLDPRTVLQQKQAGGDSFAACARDFAAQHVRGTRNWKESLRVLGLDPTTLEPVRGGLAQRWADRPIGGITDDDLFQAVEDARTGIGGTSVKKRAPLESRRRKMHAALSVLFGWLAARRRIKTNPMLNLESPRPPVSRDRVLDKTEIKKFWVATATLTPPFGDVFRLLLMTGARLNEIARLQWSELTDDGLAITLSGARTKNGRPFQLPLAPMARAIIEAQPRLGPYIFSTTQGVRPVSGWSKVKARLDCAMGDLPAWRLHDLRRTTATMLAEELDVRIEITEAILNHISGKKGGIAGVYVRSEFRAQKRQALEGWALYLLALLDSEWHPGLVQDREEKVA
jgi:integrase